MSKARELIEELNEGYSLNLIKKEGLSLDEYTLLALLAMRKQSLFSEKDLTNLGKKAAVKAAESLVQKKFMKKDREYFQLNDDHQLYGHVLALDLPRQLNSWLKIKKFAKERIEGTA